jgi:hypothetical protein
MSFVSAAIERTSFLPLILPMGFAFCLAAGCPDAGDAPGPATPTPTVRGRVGLTGLVYAPERSDPAARRAVRLHAAGLFIDHTDVDRSGALELLNMATVALPDSLASLETDECTFSASWMGDGAEAAGSGVFDLSLELLDAGAIRLRRGDMDVAMAPRAFPDVLDFIAGVTYELASGVELDFHEGETFVFLGEGSSEVGPFEAIVTAPPPIRISSIGSSRAEEGVPAVPRSGGTEVTWQGAEEGEGVFLRIEVEALLGSARLECRVQDDGAFTLSPAHLRLFPDPVVITGADLVIERVRRSTAEAAGLDELIAFFVVQDRRAIRIE